MRVLFVDDEPLILEGIERKLFHRCDDWDIVTAEGGNEALEELEDEPFDVVVSDMRMPGMDGAQLLTKVKELYPHSVRIILSGFTEVEATIRAVRVTHQFLTKPCEPDAIEKVITRAVQLKNFLASEELRAAVGHVKSLPSLPQVYADLTRALANEKCRLNQITDIVTRDPAMSAKLLQLVNSSFFTRGTPTSDMNQAVLRLGFEMVKNLAVAVEVFAIGKLPRGLRRRLSLESLQQHALDSARVAKKMLHDKRMASDAFTAAMLQDTGLLVLAAELPDKLEEAFALAETEGIAQHEAERRIIGASHAEVGAYLLGTWGLPYTIVEAVAHHDTRDYVDSTDFGPTEAVHVAHEIMRGRELPPAYLERIGVTARQVDTWREFASDLGKAA